MSTAPAPIESCSRTEPNAPGIQRDYLDAVAAALAAVLRTVGPTLAMPRVSDVDRAFRVQGHFAETMTGFALGVIAGHLFSGLRRWYGGDGVASMRAAMHGWPDRRIDAEGSIVDQLHVRFCYVNQQARGLVDAVPQRPMTSVMLSLLAKEDTIERRVADELVLGWRVYQAAVTTKRYPPMSRLWQQWQWQLDGKPMLTRDETAQAGYILLVR